MPPSKKRGNATSTATTPPLLKKTPRPDFVGAKLYEQVESGDLLDVMLIVGDRKLYAHKMVLTAFSGVFRAMLAQQLGDKNKNKKGIIQFPPGTSVPAAKAFIKGIYLKEMDPDLDILLGVILLCDQFLVEDLLSKCIDSVKELIQPENCVRICEASLVLNKPGEGLLDAAFLCLSRNVGRVLKESWNIFGSNLWKKLLHLEGPNVEIDEDFLFQQLLKWRNADPSRETVFRQLLPLIRFPLMTSETIAEIVQPSKVLSGDELADLLCYVIGGGREGKCLPKFVTHSRTWKVASNAQELQTILRNARLNDFIQLPPGEYVGPFGIYQHKVTLKGAGPSTILTREEAEDGDNLSVWANDVTISDLKIQRTSSHVPHSLAEKTSIGLSIEGSRCVMSNLNFSNCQLTTWGSANAMIDIQCDSGDAGIHVLAGTGHSLSNITLSNLKYGIYIAPTSAGNTIQNLKCANVLHGVTLESDDNVVEDVEYGFDKEKMSEKQIGVQIWGGSHNTLSRVKIEGYAGMKLVNCVHDKYGLLISAKDDAEPEDNSVTNLGPAPVSIVGQNHAFLDVDAADFLTVSGQGHKLTRCHAQKYVNASTNLELTDCSFG